MMLHETQKVLLEALWEQYLYSLVNKFGNTTYCSGSQAIGVGPRNG